MLYGILVDSGETRGIHPFSEGTSLVEAVNGCRTLMFSNAGSIKVAFLAWVPEHGTNKLKNFDWLKLTDTRTDILKRYLLNNDCYSLRDRKRYADLFEGMNIL